MFRYFFFSFISAMMILLYSCDQNSTCIETMTSNLKLEFVSYKTKKDTSFDTVYYQLPNSTPSNYTEGFVAATGAEIPLDSHHDTTAILIQYLKSNYDTIWKSVFDTVKKDSVHISYKTKWKSSTIRQQNLQVFYSRKKVFESYDCGFRTDFSLDTIISTPGFDAISIIQKNISNLHAVNCKIFFNPNTVK